MKSRLAWGVLAIVLLGALVIGARPETSGSGGDTPGAREARIARTVRCPTCRGLSAAESDAKAAVAVRTEIRRRVDAGQSDDEIRAFLAGRYGEEILLTPPARGVGALVWALPVLLLVLAGGGLAIAFRRWRPPVERATPEDQRLVERARR